MTNGNREVMSAKFQSCCIHVHANGLFPKCLHGSLNEDNAERIAWILPDTKAADALCEVLNSPYLQRSIKQMSPLHQTWGVEAFHGTINCFAPKLLSYSYQTMLCRLYVAAMHYKENSGRPQQVKKDGSQMWSITWPRGADGDYRMKKKLVPPSFDYVHELFVAVTDLALTRKSDHRDSVPSLLNVPRSLAADKERPTRAEALQRQQMRYSHNRPV